MLKMQMHALVLLAMLVGSAQAQFVADFVDHSGGQQGGSISSVEPSSRDQQAYESWVRNYRQSPLETVVGIDPSGHTIAAPALLRITVVDGEDLPIDEKQARIFGNGYLIVTYGCAVSANGRISYFRSSSSGVSGSGYPDLTSKDLLELKRLLQDLPDDHSQLPPAGRRLAIQATTAGGVVVRVYDRANLPDRVLEIIRINRAGVAPWSIHFPPERAGSTAEFWQAGLRVHWPLATSPDGSLVVSQGNYEVVISGPTKGKLHELREPEVNRRIDGLFGPFFSPDGRYLLVQSTHPAVRIYETKTWEQVQTLPSLPPDVVRYFPDKDWELGVFASSKGDIGLWDSHARRTITSLHTGEQLMDAAFSPDHSLVAFALLSKTEDQESRLRVRIWRTNGTSWSELNPRDQIQPPGLSRFSARAGLLAWWPDNEHLLTIVRPNAFFTEHNLALWNANTGRYEGDLSGCPNWIERFMVSTHEGRVFAECYAEGLRMWDGFGAINRITKFERSLSDPN